jgi:hypothetical protein
MKHNQSRTFYGLKFPKLIVTCTDFSPSRCGHTKKQSKNVKGCDATDVCLLREARWKNPFNLHPTNLFEGLDGVQGSIPRALLEDPTLSLDFGEDDNKRNNDDN